MFWFTLFRKCRIWSFHVVVLQRTAKKCTKNYNVSAAQLLYCSLILLFSGVPIATALMVFLNSLFILGECWIHVIISHSWQPSWSYKTWRVGKKQHVGCGSFPLPSPVTCQSASLLLPKNFFLPLKVYPAGDHPISILKCTCLLLINTPALIQSVLNSSDNW